MTRKRRKTRTRQQRKAIRRKVTKAYRKRWFFVDAGGGYAFPVRIDLYMATVDAMWREALQPHPFMDLQRH